MKVICKKSLLMKNGENKGKESFTEGKTYRIIQNGLLNNLCGLEGVTLENNFNVESLQSNNTFDKHFTRIF